MALAGLVMALPFLLLVALALFHPWTDRLGWTRARGKHRAMLGTTLQGYSMAVSPELNAAVEYLKECHDEEAGEGKKKRPYFPGAASGPVTIRPLRDTPADIARLSGWLAAAGAPDPGGLAAVREAFLIDLDEFEIPCVIEVAGAPVGYIQFATVPLQPGTFRIHRLLGAPLRAPVLRLLLAYLFEMEGAARVVCPSDEASGDASWQCGFGPAGPEGVLEVTPQSVRPPRCQWHLLLGAGL